MATVPTDFQWTPEQKRAIDRIRHWAQGTKYGLTLSLSGAAGTGKTTILAAVKPFLEGKNVAWAAMTGKAALRMHELVGVDATTLHKVLYERPNQGSKGQIYFNKIRNPECRYLVIDEASMMPPKIYQDLQSWIMQGIKILFVGDGYQLPPVMSYKEIKEYGKDFSIFREVEGPFLTQVMRSGDDIIKVATQLREENQVPKHNIGAYSIRRSDRPGMEAVNDFLEDNDDHILITWRNQMRMQANKLVRKRLGLTGRLPNKGEPVLICKNGSDVLNGEILWAEMFSAGPTFGTITTNWFRTDSGTQLLVSTQGKSEEMDGFFPDLDKPAWKEYMSQFKISRQPDPIPVTYGYVSTAHKAQGSEYRRVTVFLAAHDLTNDHFRAPTTLPNGQEMPFATRWLYTSLTRAKHRVSLILGT